MRERKDILNDLVRNKQDISSLVQELSKFPWDCEEPLLILTSHDICKMLDSYISGEISAKVLEDWANAIECREDLGFEEESFQEVVNRLANPILYGENYIAKIEALKKYIMCK
ncbi:MAG: hypothetical protein NDI77_01785 [Geobacteraceae bacterium]|nr:hypothetical protein [Geobacteraceae bacterium]